jgi:hypothetical protein
MLRIPVTNASWCLTNRAHFITEFGSYGFDLGQFDEPVGLAIDLNGNVYVADTWNQRIQVLAPNMAGESFHTDVGMAVIAWQGQSLFNKPYLAVDEAGNTLSQILKATACCSSIRKARSCAAGTNMQEMVATWVCSLAWM